MFLNLESTLPCSNGAGCVLDTITDFFDQVGHETMHASSGNKHFRLNNVTVRPIFLERFNQFLTLKNDFESTNFAIFDKVVHNFGKSEDVII